VLGTNPNLTESGSFGLGIWSVKGSNSLSPDPDPDSDSDPAKSPNIRIDSALVVTSVGTIPAGLILTRFRVRRVQDFDNLNRFFIRAIFLSKANFLEIKLRHF
jgi:hypothetical protein